ncbi:MAG: AzlC family ABC transporter permease [Lachnospiraceae bacterium]|nr:AzlC family ABC transporter permease [Lachnospiraceae bacterium]MBQ7506060.1 AzlC family ABC transporter permease [Lachnospiraceae bacterium]
MKTFVRGMKDGVPIALGYLAVSFTFGMMSVTKGLTVWQATLISLVNVTSAGQFAGLDIIATGGALSEMALTQLVINLRYTLMSFSLSQKIEPKTGLGKRLVLSFGITDEIYGIDTAYPGKLPPSYHYGAMAVAVPGWVFGTLLGAVAGNVLPAMIMSALGVAIYGMFLAIIIPPAKKDRSVLLVVLASMGCGCLFRYVPVLSGISSGFSIILITVGVSVVAALLSPIKEEEAA